MKNSESRLIEAILEKTKSNRLDWKPGFMIDQYKSEFDKYKVYIQQDPIKEEEFRYEIALFDKDTNSNLIDVVLKPKTESHQLAQDIFNLVKSNVSHAKFEVENVLAKLASF